MKKENRFERFGSLVTRYLVFFAVVAFVITCCLMLFASTLSVSLGIEFTKENISAAAKLTFINVLFFTALLTAADLLRRRLTIARQIKSITDAANRIMKGDFSVRIPPASKFLDEGAFQPIIDTFNDMARELSGIETLRTDFIANVSHELKTPLAVMQNYATMLASPAISEDERAEYARAITEACGRLSSLITNILKLNKLENQQIFPDVCDYDLSEQLCLSLLQFEGVWEKKGIDIETEIADGVRIRADKELLSLVWNNLLSNAFKFTPEGGRVTVALSETAHHATIRISDTGCGMSAEVGAHIFEKFYQGDTSRASEGNGLGLALVRRVIDIMGETISVESELGRGSTFTVRIKK